LHYTGMQTATEAIARLRDPAAQVSAHYVVDLDGVVIQLVEENKRAWHAGVSFWDGETDINSTSIGIEIVNPGHEFGYMPFPDAQIAAGVKLCQDILSRHPIPPHQVLAHSDIAPSRKMDPGELFPWAVLASNNIGLFPRPLTPSREERGSYFVHANETAPCPLAGAGWGGGDIEMNLSNYGYNISNLPTAITAFQRHFRPENMTGEWDDECAARLAWLLKKKSEIH